MKIEDNNVCFSLNFRKNVVRLLKRAVERGHERTARQIHDGDIHRLKRKDAVSLPGCPLRIIGGAHEKGILVNKGEDILFIPNVIA